MNRIFSLNDKNFNKEIQSTEIPLLVGFYSDWSYPCRNMFSVLDKIAGKRRFGLYKFNIENSVSVISKYKIISIPRVLLFKSGVVVNEFVGVVSVKSIEKFIKDNI